MFQIVICAMYGPSWRFRGNIFMCCFQQCRWHKQTNKQTNKQTQTNKRLKTYPSSEVTMMPESDQHHKISSVCFRYQWTLSGQPLDYYDLDDITSTTDGTLLISRATLSHEGYYQCTARNDYGSALTKVTFLQLVSEYEIILGCRCLRERSFSRAYLFVGILHNLIIIIVSYFKANGTLSVLRYDFFSVRLKSVRFHPSSSFVAYGAVCSQLTLDFFHDRDWSGKLGQNLGENIGFELEHMWHKLWWNGGHMADTHRLDEQ